MWNRDTDANILHHDCKLHEGSFPALVVSTSCVSNQVLMFPLLSPGQVHGDGRAAAQLRLVPAEDPPAPEAVATRGSVQAEVQPPQGPGIDNWVAIRSSSHNLRLLTQILNCCTISPLRPLPPPTDPLVVETWPRWRRRRPRWPGSWPRSPRSWRAWTPSWGWPCSAGRRSWPPTCCCWFSSYSSDSNKLIERNNGDIGEASRFNYFYGRCTGPNGPTLQFIRAKGEFYWHIFWYFLFVSKCLHWSSLQSFTSNTILLWAFWCLEETIFHPSIKFVESWATVELPLKILLCKSGLIINFTYQLCKS